MNDWNVLRFYWGTPPLGLGLPSFRVSPRWPLVCSSDGKSYLARSAKLEVLVALVKFETKGAHLKLLILPLVRNNPQHRHLRNYPPPGKGTVVDPSCQILQADPSGQIRQVDPSGWLPILEMQRSPAGSQFSWPLRLARECRNVQGLECSLSYLVGVLAGPCGRLGKSCSCWRYFASRVAVCCSRAPRKWNNMRSSSRDEITYGLRGYVVELASSGRAVAARTEGSAMGVFVSKPSPSVSKLFSHLSDAMMGPGDIFCRA